MSNKIAVVVTNRASYARILTVLRALHEDERIRLAIVLGGSAILERFGKTADEMEKFPRAKIEKVNYSLEGGTLEAMAKSTGLATIEMTSVLSRLHPQLVVTVADRFETLATATAAAYLNIPLAHTQGGEVSGSIDNKVRHAVSQLADFHFPATKLASQKLMDMGIDSGRVYRFGCPAIDLARQTDLSIKPDFFAERGASGEKIDATRPYLLFLQHPVTTDYGHQATEQFAEILRAADTCLSNGFQLVWLWPNIDAGSNALVRSLRYFLKQNEARKIVVFSNFVPEDYLKVIGNASCIVGNSSSGIREAAFLGIPAVNIGSRQSERERAHNVVNAGFSGEEIWSQVRHQVRIGRYSRSEIFGKGQAGVQIAKKLTEIVLSESRMQRRSG